MGKSGFRGNQVSSGGSGRGRGEFYKNKYGRGNRAVSPKGGKLISRGSGGSFSAFLNLLENLEGQQYSAYHALETTQQGWVHDNFTLHIKRTQSDPFAPPTQCQIQVSSNFTLLPPSLYSNKIRRMALADYLHRTLYSTALEIGANTALAGKGWSGPKGGDIAILPPCQHVLEQSAVIVQDTGNVLVQLTINLPARGRTILGVAAKEIFGQSLLHLLENAIRYESINPALLNAHVDSIEDQVWLQHQLSGHGLVAFVKDGAILPRASGVDDGPLQESLAFEAPSTMKVQFQLPSTGIAISGMGFKCGVSLICGGGFHGKSTLLEALQFGVYPKVPGDGREFCVTNPSAFKVRSEDGRSVNSVDISSFISNLPFGKDTTNFSTLDASGSTSQASSIIEAVEMDTKLLLFDEDTCATNFMIRDAKMIELVAANKEPITPFLHKVRSLYEEHGVSSILAMGGSGDYFAVADSVVMMDCYKCLDVTSRAKAISASDSAVMLAFGPIRSRQVDCNKLKLDGKVAVRSQQCISYGDVELDTSALEQVVSKSQNSAIGQACRVVSQFSHGLTIQECMRQLDQLLDKQGMNVLAPEGYHGGLSRPRTIDVAAAINRFRKDGIIILK